MSGDHDDEPIFVCRRGTLVYNPNNPIGRALIVNVRRVRERVHVPPLRQLAVERGRVSGRCSCSRTTTGSGTTHLGGPSRLQDLIEEAVQEAGQGPEHTVIDVEPINDSDATGAAGSVGGGHGLDTFEISTDDVVTTYCMRMSPPHPETDMPKTKTVTLTVNVKEGPC
ncbi:hypothetical protein OHS70_36400 [Streptomyces sp. NBC_00390]|uniref:hypothetical protein n=1 Tax=Streptomyces sp. NBC_00390 TaxID=2975736 RepID=UPI002E1D9C1F